MSRELEVGDWGAMARAKRRIADAAAAEAEAQRAREEKRERLARLYRQLMMSCEGITLETDRITFTVEGDDHRYEIREID